MSDLAEIHVLVASEAAAALANLLTERVGAGIEQRDGDTLAAPQPGMVELVVWLPREQVETLRTDTNQLLDSLRAMDVAVDPFSWKECTVDVDSWVDVYRSHFKATRIGRRFLVRPSWEQVQAGADDLVIELDPGMAFGTGLHASTRLSMTALERIVRLAPTPRTILDLGCGSGILAIASALLWPSARILAVDIDPVAVDVARDNVERNGQARRIEVAVQGGHEFDGRFDVVVANLSYDVLEQLEPRLGQHLTRTGRLVLSGLLADQAVDLARLYCRQLKLEAEYSEEADGWRAISLRQRS